MPFFPSTLRCGSVFMACPTNQANFLICHFFKLSSCHLQVVPEEPSAPSNCQREIKYQNNLCIVSQNHFSSVISQRQECSSSQLTWKIQVTRMSCSFRQSQIPSMSHCHLKQLTPGILVLGKTGIESNTRDGDP